MKKKIYTIATAHLDTIWSWDFETTVSKYIYNTLVDNFKLFKKYPHYTFSFEGSYRYELMQEYYPELFEKMRGYVEEGRWNVCGSAFENGDVNVPSPEALFRNILFGNTYFEKTFGKTSCDIFLPDCFGFGWALPSIAHHAGLKGFTTQKLAWGSAYGVPFDIGKWYGPDGNYIYANINPHDYYFTLTKLRDWDFVQKKLKENEKYDLPLTAVFHGIGDRGGAPPEKSVAFVEQEIGKNAQSDLEVLSVPADQIFHDLDKDLTPQQKEKLPVWDTELVMRDHGAGGYTSRAIGKRWNRRCEELADMAERMNLVAQHIGAKAYPHAAMERHWKRFIAHQFHDDLPGTSVQRAYRRSWNDYAVSMNGFAGEFASAVAAVADRMKTDFASGMPVVVSNMLEFRRSAPVTLEIKNPAKNFARVFDDKGREVKSQVTDFADGRMTLLFVADVPAMGCRAYDVRMSDVPCALASAVSVSDESVLENQKYVVRLNKNGYISSIVDKTLDDREILKAPVINGVFKYKGSKDWPAWELNYEDLNKEPDFVPAGVSVSVEERGPVRVALKVTRQYDKSTFTDYIALADGSDIVEVYSEIEWQNRHRCVKNKFSFTAKNPQASFDLGLGYISRGNMNSTLFEVPAQKWVDLTDESGEFGVSVFSECKYGWDKWDDNTLRMTVVHTPAKNYRIDSMQSMMDLGLNRYSYAIYSHSGGCENGCDQKAKAFVQPMAAVQTTKHGGDLPVQFSCIEVSEPNVDVRAVKPGIDGRSIVLRVNEMAGTAKTGVKVRLFDGVDAAAEINACEKEIGPAQLQDGALVFDLKPFEVKSFAVSAPAAETAVHSRELALEKNVRFVTGNGDTASADLDYSVPAEILPDKIYTCGIEFETDRAGGSAKNAVLCKGQTVQLPEGTKAVAFLVTSLKGDCSAEFASGADSVSVPVADAFENFAAWDLYDFQETAYIKDVQIGYEATHTHSKKGDMYAKNMYFTLVVLNVSGSSLTLPADENLVILASSALDQPVSGALLTRLYDRVENRRPFEYYGSMSDLASYHFSKTLFMMNDKGGYFKDFNRK